MVLTMLVERTLKMKKKKKKWLWKAANQKVGKHLGRYLLSCAHKLNVSNLQGTEKCFVAICRDVQHLLDLRWAKGGAEEGNLLDVFPP